MRANLEKVLTLALATWVLSSLALAQDAGAQAPQGGATAAKKQSIDPDGSRMQWILGQWAKQSQKLKTLDVKIHLVEDRAKWGAEEFEGRAMFRAPNHAFLDFSKIVVQKDGAKKTVHDHRIVCTGKDIWEYRTAQHQIFIHELGDDQQDRTLQEGPLPFLFNFKAENARKRYKMILAQVGEHTYTILVMPLLKIDKESFHHAFIQLDKQFLLPIRISLTAPEGKDVRDYVLSDHKVNKKVMDVNFQGQKFPGWTVQVDKAGQPPAQDRAPGNGLAPRQAMQPRSPR